MIGFDVIINQIEDFCACLDTSIMTNEQKIRLENAIKSAFSIIGAELGYPKECDSLFLSWRKEFISIPCFICKPCNDNVAEFIPLYDEPRNIEVFIEITNGVAVSYEKLDENNYFYDEISGILRIDYSSNKCNCCDTEQKYLISYQSGWELIPDCLLPMFCEFVHLLYDMTKCKCSSCNDDDEDITSDVIVEYLLNHGYREILSRYSLYRKIDRGIRGYVSNATHSKRK